MSKNLCGSSDQIMVRQRPYDRRGCFDLSNYIQKF